MRTIFILIALLLLSNNLYAVDDCTKYNEKQFILGYFNGMTKQLCRTANSLEVLEKKGVKSKLSIFGKE